MAKYNNSFFLQLPRDLFTEKYRHLSDGAKLFYVWLNELEQRFGDDFYRTDSELAADTGMSIASIKRYKAELKKTDLVKIYMDHFVDNNTGKKSAERVTCYRIK